LDLGNDDAYVGAVSGGDSGNGVKEGAVADSQDEDEYENVHNEVMDESEHYDNGKETKPERTLVAQAMMGAPNSNVYDWHSRPPFS